MVLWNYELVVNPEAMRAVLLGSLAVCEWKDETRDENNSKHSARRALASAALSAASAEAPTSASSFEIEACTWVGGVGDIVVSVGMRGALAKQRYALNKTFDFDYRRVLFREQDRSRLCQL